MYVATIQCLNYSGQESKTCSLQFIFLTPATLKQSVIKPTMTTQIPIKVMIMQSLKHLALMVSEKKPTFQLLSRQGNMSIISLEHVQKKKKQPKKNPKERKKKWYIHDALDVINNHTKFQLNRIKTKKLIKTVLHCWPQNTIKLT